MKRHAVILMKDLLQFDELVEKHNLKIKNKQLFFIHIKYIKPLQFHEKIWEKNWSDSLEKLTNGDLFEEVHILVLDSLKDVNELYSHQLAIINSKSVFLSGKKGEKIY